MRICVKLSVKVSVGINGSVEVLSRGHVPGGKYNLIWLYALWYWSQGDLMELCVFSTLSMYKGSYGQILQCDLKLFSMNAPSLLAEHQLQALLQEHRIGRCYHMQSVFATYI
ncbi:hypothetical protein F2Q70_00031192 [Brassica cretica]|uniref:Uncharacterized protein n=1 Tax=Brassica cretica TaxID=69181 RepID=A0A8S9FLN2_BRACR|nr:hypothetical protein F2Q70_00031192 [Brassica cretica]